MSQPAAARPADAPPLLHRSLETLGPIGVKIGQYLACRPDVVPEDQVGGLFMLVERAPPEPWSTVSDIIATDLGRPAESVFRWINPTPELSGPLAQVHLARALDDAPLVVKVLRPGAARAVDTAPLDKALRAVGNHSELNDIVRDRLEEDIRLWLHDQIDLERECSNTARLRDVDVRGACFRAPIPYPEHSGPRVLTMERLRGIRLSDLLPMASQDAAGFRALGLHRNDLADNVVESVLQQAFALDLFAAAPHPSHLVALSDGLVGFVDLAFVARIDASVRDRLLVFVAAAHTGDFERLVRAAAALTDTSAHDRLGAFRSDFLERARQLRRDSELAADDGRALPALMGAVVDVAQRHDIPLGSEIVAYHRCVLTADALARSLSPGAGLRHVAADFFLRAQVQAAIGQLSFNNVQALTLDTVELLTKAPGQLGQLLSDLAEDRFVFRVATSESDEERRSGNRRARLVSLAIIFVGVAILATGPDFADAAAGFRAIGYAMLGAVAVLFAMLWARLR